MTKFIRETSMTLFDKTLVHCSVGEFAQVNFDSAYCLSIRKKYKPKQLTMIHVHPDNCLWMSTSGEVNDRNMVKGWSLAFGVPIVFIIISKVNLRIAKTKRYAFIKYVVELENNKPIIHEVKKRADLDDVIIGPLKYLTKASTDSWFNDYNFRKLNKLVGTKIELSKVLL